MLIVCFFFIIVHFFFYIYNRCYLSILGEIIIEGAVGVQINFGFIGIQTTIVTITTTTTIIGGAIVVPTPVGPAVELIQPEQCITVEPAADQACMLNPEECAEGFTVVWNAMFTGFVEDTVSYC